MAINRQGESVMTRELNSLLARLEDVVERMPDCFNTYEFAQKLACNRSPGRC